jgi:spermidine synthase
MKAIIGVLGCTTMLLQLTALRELMTVFAGNELDLGITLAVWLAAVAFGSAAGRTIRSSAAFGMAVAAAGLLAQPLLSLAPSLPQILSLEMGEAVPLGWTILATAAILVPFCIPLGMQFPLAAAALAGNAASAYLLEAAGAFCGGMLSTFVLAGRVPAPVVLTAIACVHVLLAARLAGRKRVALLLLVPLATAYGFSHVHRFVQGEDLELVSRTESRYGLIEVYGSRDQYSIYAAGKLQYAYPDAPSEELKVHLPLALHPGPERVLLVGGSPALVREVLKHPVSAVGYVELDPAMVRAAGMVLTADDRAALRDPRVTVLTDDARRYIKSLAGPQYDLIVLNLPEPSTANLNRCYTVEFFREAKNALRDGGVITVSLPVAFGYVGKRMQMANGAVYQALAAVFPHTALSSEEYGQLAGSDRPIAAEPALLQSRFERSRADAAWFHPYLFDDAFAPLKTKDYRRRLEQVRTINRDDRPAAYLYNVLVWAEMQRSGALGLLVGRSVVVISVALALAAAAAVLLRRAGRTVLYTVTTTGFTSMTLTLVILLAYQGAYGYVYERVGLLAASFMAGSAAGAYLVRDTARPLRLLQALEAAMVIVLLGMPWLLRHEPLFLLLAVIAGAAGGAVFAAAAAAERQRGTGGGAGLLYALDLAGSVAGALPVAVFLVPVLGMHRTLLFAAALKILSLAALLSLRHEEA